jgi:alkylated DNA repair dioxygenase AlkB
MDAYVSRTKRRKLLPSPPTSTAAIDLNGCAAAPVTQTVNSSARISGYDDDDDDDGGGGDDLDTDVKLAMLLSLFPNRLEAELLDILVSCDGDVEAASAALARGGAIIDGAAPSTQTSPGATFLANKPEKIQTSLSSFAIIHATTSSGDDAGEKKRIDIDGSLLMKAKTKKGKTLHLFTVEDIAASTPCSLIPNFLAPAEANALLEELLEESKTFERYTFQLFQNTVQSPHTSAFFVANLDDHRRRRSGNNEYVYNGKFRSDVRPLTPCMRAVSEKVQRAVNEEVRKRIRTHYPGGRKLRYQSPRDWVPNVAVVNCYNGPSESVGYHSDELTYLGPRAIIGSLSLGVSREFRVRRVVARDDVTESTTAGAADDDGREKTPSHQKNGDLSSSSGTHPDKRDNMNVASTAADSQGQISIHLPHNSLLVMHAEMQEEWKHSIPAVQTIEPHPVSGNRRINITYRWYRESLRPAYTPRCRCGIPTVLRCVQRKRETRGRYMWMCYAGAAPGKEGCSFFQWAEFDDDGEPVWNTEPVGGRRRKEGNV